MSTTPPAPPPGPRPNPPSPPSAASGRDAGRGPGQEERRRHQHLAGALHRGRRALRRRADLRHLQLHGKSSAEDDKDKAQKELASTKKELNDTQGELGTQQGAGQILGDLVRTGETSASDLKACADSARQLRSNIVDALNAVQAGTGINDLVDGINAQINQNDNVCNTSDTSYQDFIDALEKVRD